MVESNLSRQRRARPTKSKTILVFGSLVDEFKQKKLALSSAESSRHCSTHRSTKLERIGFAFIDIDTPVR